MRAEYGFRTRDTMDEALFEALKNMVYAYSMVNESGEKLGSDWLEIANTMSKAILIIANESMREVLV